MSFLEGKGFRSTMSQRSSGNRAQGRLRYKIKFLYFIRAIFPVMLPRYKTIPSPVQLCMTAAVCAAEQKAETLYIDTANSVNAKRIHQIAQSRSKRVRFCCLKFSLVHALNVFELMALPLPYPRTPHLTLSNCCSG